MIPRVQGPSPQEIKRIEVEGHLREISLHKGDQPSVLHAFDGCTVLFSIFICSDGGPNGGASAFHVNIVLNGGRDSEQRREVLFHVPLVFHGPVPFFCLSPLLVTLPRSFEGILEVVLGDYAGLSAVGGCSYRVDSQQLLRGDGPSIELVDESDEIEPSEMIDAFGSNPAVFDDVLEDR